MRLLDDVHRRVASTGRPHLVTIYGDAGMGKTRVALEFLRRLDPVEPIARAACLPYGHAITYWPLQELIRGEAAITPTDGRDAARAKIETRVAGMEGLDELEARAIARELAALALADADTPQTELTSDARRRELALGMTRYLEARLGTTPGTLVVEEYVHMLVDQGSRAVVPATLHGVIAARIDATTPGVKRLLHEASVIGRDFWLDALPTAPAGADVAEAERRGLISRRARRGPSGSPTVVFRHGLIRDVAYSSLSN